MRPQQPISFSSTAVIFLSLLSVASRVNSQDSFGQADVRSFGGAGSQGSEDSLGSVGGAPPPPHQNPFARRPSNINNDGSDSRHQNPFGNRPANANNGDPNSGDQNPIGQNSGGNNNGDSGPGNQNSFNQNSGNTNTGASNPAGNQNSGNAGTGNSNSGGSQNPAGQNFGNNGNDNSNSGSQNPLGQNSGNVNPSGPNSGTQNPSGGGFGPLVNGVGCPNARVAAPASTDRLVYANSPVCPSGEGQLYQSPDGATFFIQCCSHSPHTLMHTFVAADFKSCMDECSKTNECLSVQYLAHGRLSSEVQDECRLYKEGGFSTGACGDDTHNYAYIIDPPAIDSLDIATIQCSTECPYADGQQFVTSVGEAFRIECKKRHGTKVIYQDKQESLEDCVESCGKLLACHSVDYDTNRKTCYYGNHHGQPTILAESFASAYSLGCAGACTKKCEGNS